MNILIYFFNEHTPGYTPAKTLASKVLLVLLGGYMIYDMLFNNSNGISLLADAKFY